MGGKRKNMPKSKRAAMTGRGAVGKEAVVGVKDRATNRVSAHHVHSTDSLTVANVVAANAKFGATLFTDDASAYDMLDPYYDHEAVNHSAGEYVRGMAHTNGIESFWSMLKRGYQGTYHKMSPKHLERYINEFSGRHNVREADTIDQMEVAFTHMIGKHLAYRTLIADNGMDSGARSA